MSVLDSIFWNNRTSFLRNYIYCKWDFWIITHSNFSFYRIDRYLWAICNKKIQERGRAEKNLENMTMSLTAIEYQIYSYVKNTYMIIVYSLSIYDKRLFQLIWQGSGASNSEINIFILIFFIFAQWPVLMYNR